MRYVRKLSVSPNVCVSSSPAFQNGSHNVEAIALRPPRLVRQRAPPLRVERLAKLEHLRPEVRRKLYDDLEPSRASGMLQSNMTAIYSLGIYDDDMDHCHRTVHVTCTA